MARQRKEASVEDQRASKTTYISTSNQGLVAIAVAAGAGTGTGRQRLGAMSP